MKTMRSKTACTVYSTIFIFTLFHIAAAAMNQSPVYPYKGSYRMPLSVGETWVFEHHGVQTSGKIGQPVDGDRIQEVVSKNDRNGKTLSVMKETWGKNDLEPKRYFLDVKRLIHQVEHGAESFTIDPPVCFSLVDLEPNKEIEYNAVEKSDVQSFDINLKARRLIDETVETPAGTFEDCQKVKLAISFEHPQEKGTMIHLHYMIWYHPKANGMVKESFKCIPPSPDGQPRDTLTAVSLLKSYSKMNEER